ncbi:hypothetical protein EDC94DRAFT_411745 [Helicostylum pulchrum]|uniref:Uncharacterized protein n=1 Tax=Helicostylum pulchrum TaxID=562976 RepID=A0ABP9YBW1_9FUNG|nr:hypothetical protein EDC94DRAFT_411745 [Helicostylum pulchrum]
MSRLANTPPLKIVSRNNLKQVLLYVNEPLLPRKENKKTRQELQLLKQLAQLELLLAKIERLELWKSDSLLKNLHENVSTIRLGITSQSSNMPLLEIIRAEKTLYNRSIQFILSHTQLVSTTDQQQYQLSYLDQLYVTACRLYHDLDLPNHKYIAYQLALLYQCINRQGVPFIEYKARIEQRFDEIKSATKELNTVRLDSGQVSWIQSLSLDIIMQVTDSSSITKCSKLFNVMYQMKT